MTSGKKLLPHVEGVAGGVGGDAAATGVADDAGCFVAGSEDFLADTAVTAAVAVVACCCY